MDSKKGPVAGFWHFPRLPLQTRFRIWELSTPDPRSVRCVVLFNLNYDMDDPRAIVPTRKGLNRFYRSRYYADLGQRICGVDNWDLEKATSLEPRKDIFSIMHTCMESRLITRRTYRFDLKSIIAAKDVPLWRDDDLVYFRCSDSKWHHQVMYMYLTDNFGVSKIGFNKIHHVAFDLNSDFSFPMQYWSPSAGDQVRGGFGTLDYLPRLKSVMIRFDPSGLYKPWHMATTALVEPTSYLKIGNIFYSAEELEARITKILRVRNKRRAVPAVSILVMSPEPRTGEDLSS